MPDSLDDLVRQSLFIIKDGQVLRKIKLPNHWQCAFVSTPPQLLSCLFQGHSAGQKMVLLVSEAQFGATFEILRDRADANQLMQLGIVVIAKSEEEFILKNGWAPEVVDVLSEKVFRMAPEIHLIRAVRQLFRADDQRNPRVNQRTLELLNQVFISLSAEREPQKLLATILAKAVDLTNASAGTFYVVEEVDGEIFFRIKMAHDRSIQHEMRLSHLNVKAMENSIAGYSALTGKLLNIADVTTLPTLSLPQFHRQFDHNADGKTRSMLTLPLKNSRQGTIGILQLVNKASGGSSNPSTAFDRDDESLLSSFVTQAAICIENVDLYADIQKLFDGFVKAAITAIESRDPSTGGHSERVAKMTVALARATTECDRGIYRSVRFKDEEMRELEYAALLHDFGKIGVREEVLCKAKKLYTFQLESIQDRLKIWKAAARLSYVEGRLQQGKNEELSEKGYHQRCVEIDGYWQIINAANEPSVLKEESLATLDRLRREQIILVDGSTLSLLKEEEYEALSVNKGSLTERERLEIESHVRHTYQFLKMIPWTKDFRHLPEIAYCHHEKLDGSGYPRALTSHEIPLQSKIMAIADIYDALTAADRWYKDALPTEKALDILAHETSEGKLDPILFELFLERRIYELTHPRIQRHEVG